MIEYKVVINKHDKLKNLFFQFFSYFLIKGLYTL